MGRVIGMCPMVNTDDLCDAHDVAVLLGLSHANSVFGYMRRYEDLPRPVVMAGRGRLALWLRPEVERWRSANPRRQRPGRAHG
jgi:predicted DNA-binding transcriptional regulator AlpA